MLTTVSSAKDGSLGRDLLQGCPSCPCVEGRLCPRLHTMGFGFRLRHGRVVGSAVRADIVSATCVSTVGLLRGQGCDTTLTALSRCESCGAKIYLVDLNCSRQTVRILRNLPRGSGACCLLTVLCIHRGHVGRTIRTFRGTYRLRPDG